MSCVGILLAGGRSSRMGTDKATLRRFGESMLCFSRRILREAGCDSVTVSGNRVNAIADSYPGLGPMAGIATTINSNFLQTATSVLVLPVDLPLVTPSLLSKLIQEGESAQKPCYYDQHYLPCYIPINNGTRKWLTDIMSNPPESPIVGDSSDIEPNAEMAKGPSVRQFLFAHDGFSIICDEPSKLTNTNTPQQWQEAKQALTLKERD